MKREIMKLFQTMYVIAYLVLKYSRSTVFRYQEPIVYIEHYNMHANANFSEERVAEA